MDHYQYYHYKEILSDKIYNSKIHSSTPITVGVLFGWGNGQFNSEQTVHSLNPITDCLTRHALLGKLILDEEIIKSLNHKSEVSNMRITNSKTVNTFFGEEVIFSLIAGGIILIIILFVYGLIDYFLVRKGIFRNQTIHEEDVNHHDFNAGKSKFHVHDQMEETVHFHEIPKTSNENANNK